MANNLNKTSVKACKFLTADASVTNQCQLKAESGAIAKVLSVQGTSKLMGKEVLNGEVTFDGELNCRMMYIDGEGVRKVLCSTCEFRDSIKIDVAAGNTVMLSSCVSDVAAAKVEVDGVTLKAIVDVRATACVAVGIDAVTDCGEGMYGKTNELKCMVPSGLGETTFTTVCEKEADVDGEILTMDASVGLTSLTPRVDGVVAEGTVICNALYKSMDGQLKNMCFSTAFCEEVPVAGINAEAAVCGQVCVKSAETSVTRADGVPTAMKCTVSVTAQALACMPSGCAVVTDAFCPDCNVTFKTEPFMFGRMASARVTKNVEGTAELSEGMPSLDQVLGVTAVRIGVANVFYQDGKTKIEGVLAAAVLYYNKEFGTTNSVAVDLPYSVGVDCEIAATRGTAVVTDINAKSFRAGKIDLAAEVRFDLTELSSASEAVMVELECTPTETTDEAGVTVYCANADMELWDVAKGLNVAPDSVVNENPNLAFPTVGGEKVVLYRPLKLQ